jgi:predicted transcriptional regulator of viral defense system
MKKLKSEEIIEIVRKTGTLRPRDLDIYGIPREYLRRLCRLGLLERLSRGIYVLPDAEITEHHSLAQACKKVPHGVVCLFSALRFYGFTTQAPFEVWMAIDRKARRPRLERPQLRIVRFSGEALKSGVEKHLIEGVAVKVYDPAKTVADCFKYRNKIGLDVALEALRECIRERKCTMDEIWYYARVCRVANIIRPYMESFA